MKHDEVWEHRLRAGVFMLLLSILILVLPLAAYGEGGDGTGNPRGFLNPWVWYHHP